MTRSGQAGSIYASEHRVTDAEWLRALVAVLEAQITSAQRERLVYGLLAIRERLDRPSLIAMATGPSQP